MFNITILYRSRDYITNRLPAQRIHTVKNNNNIKQYIILL